MMCWQDDKLHPIIQPHIEFVPTPNSWILDSSFKMMALSVYFPDYHPSIAFITEKPRGTVVTSSMVPDKMFHDSPGRPRPSDDFQWFTPFSIVWNDTFVYFHISYLSWASGEASMNSSRYQTNGTKLVWFSYYLSPLVLFFWRSHKKHIPCPLYGRHVI